MPNSSTKATQGSVQSENRTNKINGQATAEDKQIMMMRFVSDLYVPVSARLQDPLLWPRYESLGKLLRLKTRVYVISTLRLVFPSAIRLLVRLDDVRGSFAAQGKVAVYRDMVCRVTPSSMAECPHAGTLCPRIGCFEYSGGAIVKAPTLVKMAWGASKASTPKFGWTMLLEGRS
ncbi:hypothetical protein FOXB_09583 [Fusarium oxysporum f. sp. conglutinans Fo5176]|uniref:Uncharacterized protein n=1 Tax=Fusarium oxysporum (strain Fo5176) TaxID=660025 RepID=F9FT52_FUSOF|nr:hypothetical protein FOXB_09583 [Fusarium oxysporum f. sp. conglutinans Fo5176]